MWPFSTKQPFPGVVIREDGTISFSLSDDEAAAADRALSALKDIVVHPNHAEEIRKGTAAVGLSQYASDLVLGINTSMADTAQTRKTVDRELRKAIAAVWKAYGLSSLPIYLYHRARYLRILGMTGESDRLCAAFLSRQGAFEPNAIEQLLLTYEGTDVNSALAYAEEHTKHDRRQSTSAPNPN